MMFKFVALAVVISHVFLKSSWGWKITDCDKSNTTVLNCNQKGLKTIPTLLLRPNTLDNYQILDFSSNHITRLTNLNFSFQNNVNEIRLSNNKISAIDPGAFEEMTKLVKLDLSINNLAGMSLEGKQFDKLLNIQILNMSRNPLRIIKRDIFDFYYFNSLQLLDLSHCQISTIQNEAFTGTFLKHLDLSWNELEVFPVHAFKTRLKLLSLNLSHNNLKVLNKIPELPNIQVFNFDNNRITTVSIRKDLEEGCEMLERIYLRNNYIESIAATSFYWAHDLLKGIYLDGNPLVCDCRMKWAIDSKEFEHETFSIPCVSPPEHRGRNLLTIPADQLLCFTPPFHTRILSSSIIILVLTAIFLAFSVSLYRSLKRKWRKDRRKQRRSKRFGGANYTSVYTKEGEEVMIYTSKYERLENEGQEFDV